MSAPGTAPPNRASTANPPTSVAPGAARTSTSAIAIVEATKPAIQPGMPRACRFTMHSAPTANSGSSSQ